MIKLQSIIDAKLCTKCGACVVLDESGKSVMRDTSSGPIPEFSEHSVFPEYAEQACPAIGVKYPDLYKKCFGHYPENWLIGHVINVRTGYSGQPDIRLAGASGGVLTQTLIYLLETGRVDAVVLAKQGVPTAEKARAVIATTREEIIAGAQSVYIPVSMLDVLRDLEPGKKYAMTCLPEQSAALRMMQNNGNEPAKQIKYVTGPYTGTALYPVVIRCFLKSKRVNDNDPITSLNWQANK